MANINEARKANRLVTGRRYGNMGNNLDFQEPFTSTIDINSKEVYTDAHLLPSSSLPFSSSLQSNYYILSDGTYNTQGLTAPPANAIARYWWRHQLTETSADNQTVYFFLNPPGQVEGELANSQVVSDSHVTNFISNKYYTGSASPSSTAEDDTAGLVGNPVYNIHVSYLTINQTSQTAADATTLLPAYYSFDYKTGVLQIINSPAGYAPLTTALQDTDLSTTAGTGLRIFVTAYQYVGKTLRTKLAELDSTISNLGPGGGGGGSFISSSNGQTIVSASNDGVSIQVGNVAVGGFSSTSASFSVPITSSASGIGFYGTASWAINSATASYVNGNVFTSTNLALSASYAHTASNISNAFVNATPAPANQLVFSAGSGNVSGSTQFTVDPTGNANAGSLSVGGVTLSNSGIGFTDNGGAFNIGVTGAGTQAITIDPNSDTGNGLITFNYTASFVGPTTFLSANTSTFDDQFILLASGSGGAKDSGIVFEDWSINGAIGTGSVLFADNANTKRLAYRFTGSVDQTDMTPQAFINMTFVKKPGADYNFASKTAVDDVIGDNVGFMWLDENGDIYIKS